MNKNDARLAAMLLEKASDEFSNHGSNDMELPATPENIDFVVRMWKALNGEDVEVKVSDGKIVIPDSLAMSYCARMLADGAGDVEFENGERMSEGQLDKMLTDSSQGGFISGIQTARAAIMAAALKSFAGCKDEEANLLRRLASSLPSKEA